MGGEGYGGEVEMWGEVVMRREGWEGRGEVEMGRRGVGRGSDG